MDAFVTLPARYVSRMCITSGWIPTEDQRTTPDDLTTLGVAVLQGSEYAFEPSIMKPEFVSAVKRLGANIVLTMSSEITSAFILSLSPNQQEIIIGPKKTRLPVVPNLHEVQPTSTDASPARSCVVMKENLVLIWADDITSLNLDGQEIENGIMGQLCGPHFVRNGGVGHESTKTEAEKVTNSGALNEKNTVYIKAIALESGPDLNVDIEADALALPSRPICQIHAIRVGLVMLVVMVMVGFALSKLLNEFMWDGGFVRFALLVVLPAASLFSLFLIIVLFGSLFQILAPLGPALINTKYHSAIKPRWQRHRNYELPHITIQMPVYKEGLKGVIVPTVMSLIVAIADYERRGGTASIYVNDDGMQVIQPDLALARQQYYRENKIGYCARLPNMKPGPKKKSRSRFPWSKSSLEEENQQHPDIPEPQVMANTLGFQRKGKFKKASNMNYCLGFSMRVELEISRLTTQRCAERECTYESLTIQDDDELYSQAMTNVLEADQGRTWAEGNVRIGELILIIDCDTRVPEDCLYYGALEMHESPEVAILQHGSGVMQVVHNIFENGIAYFTSLIYTAIRYAVGTGDVAPFVGHNAFLRWKAIQSVEHVDPIDGQRKWWSDAHVSEDFDISLRLQMNGMIVRLATYHEGGFKEGVSLTLYDEIARWEKYAYGCNELCFHPLWFWPIKGPFTKLFLRFLFSGMPVTSKITIIAYISTYYAIGAGLFLTLINYLVIGLWPDDIDHFYLPSWNIFVTLLVVFSGLSTLAFSLLRHRMTEKQFLPALAESIKWLPFLSIYFGGVSMHCARALLCHMFGINIEWSSTSKEIGPTGFFINLGFTFKHFKYVFLICILIIGMMIYFGVFAPWDYRITSMTVIVPLSVQVISHMLLPFALGLV